MPQSTQLVLVINPWILKSLWSMNLKYEYQYEYDSVWIWSDSVIKVINDDDDQDVIVIRMGILNLNLKLNLMVYFKIIWISTRIGIEFKLEILNLIIFQFVDVFWNYDHYDTMILVIINNHTDTWLSDILRVTVILTHTLIVKLDII